MRGRVLSHSRSLCPAAIDLTVAHDHRADRHVVVFKSKRGLAHGEAHEVVLAWEEMVGHRRARHGPAAEPQPEHHHYRKQCPPRPPPVQSPPPRRAPRQPGEAAAVAVCLALGAALALHSPSRAEAASYAPGRIVVRFGTRERAVAASAGAAATKPTPERTVVLRVRRGEDIHRALGRLRRRRDVPWAVPDFRPTPPARSSRTTRAAARRPADWQELQWNLVGPFGVEAPEAWSNLIADGRPGGTGVTVAVLDTGVAYANRGRFRRSPDFGHFQFVKGYDFVDHDPYPNDSNGHGTFVASVIAEETNNGYGLTGVAYGAKIMPVRVLDTAGRRRSLDDRAGVRFAVATARR